MTRRKLGIAAAVALALAVGMMFVLVVATRDKTRLRLASRKVDVVVTRDVVYVAGSGHPKHKLDVVAPKGKEGAPVVHFVHGGSWTKEDKDYYALVTGLYDSVGVALAQRGIVTVIQSYRLAPEVGIDGILDDVMAALRWTQAHAREHGGDPRRVFLMGHSAGGHIVALVGADESLHTRRGMDPTAIRGTIPISAVWDVPAMADEHGASFNAKVTRAVFGDDRAAWNARSPLTLLHRGMAPFFVIVGERDYGYMIPQAERARDRLSELGENPRFLVAPGNDHRGMVLAFGATGDNMTDPIVDFVTAHR